jgi:translocator protein
MWIAIIMTLRAFKTTDRAAAAMFVPYLAWVSFATALNFAFWWLNG